MRYILTLLLFALPMQAQGSEIIPPRIVINWLIKTVQGKDDSSVRSDFTFDEKKHGALTQLSRNEQIQLLKDIPVDNLQFDKDKYAMDAGDRFVVKLVSPIKLDFEIEREEIKGELGPPYAYRVIAIRKAPVDPVKELIEALAGGHGDLAARKAYKELRLSGSTAVPYLTEAVKDKRRNVRWLSVEVLGAIGGPETAPALIEAMGDPDKDVRRYAATFLGQVGAGDAASLAALRKGLTDEDTEVVLNVLWSLDRLGDKAFRQDEALLGRLLGQLRQGQTAWSAQCLGILRNEKAVEPLVQALRAKPMAAQEIGLALAEIRSRKAVPGLVGILKESGIDSRSIWQAAITLQKLGDPSANEELLAMTDSSSPWTSLAAVEALGFTGNKDAITRLSQLATDRKLDKLRREGAVRALGRTEEPSAVAALGATVVDPEERVANEAAMALGWVKSREATAVLRSRLNAGSCGHVMYAVTSLGRIGDLSDAQAILEVFDRKDALDSAHFADPRMANVATACHFALADITKTQLTSNDKFFFVIRTPQRLQEVREAWRQKLAQLNAVRELPEDLKLIRKTYLRNPDKPVNASSGEAVAAAVRIFKNVDFIGMRREAVLALLGDPKTISDYGVVAKKGKNEPLVYRFDSGFGGWQFTLHFKDDVVTRLQTEGMN